MGLFRPGGLDHLSHPDLLVTSALFTPIIKIRTIQSVGKRVRCSPGPQRWRRRLSLERSSHMWTWE